MNKFEILITILHTIFVGANIFFLDMRFMKYVIHGIRLFHPFHEQALAVVVPPNYICLNNHYVSFTLVLILLYMATPQICQCLFTT